MLNKKVKIQYSIIIRITILLFIITTLFIQSGCSMDGARYLTIVDEDGLHLRGVLIIPLYFQSTGIAFGPEGRGYHTKEKLIVTKPFIFNSGEDLMEKKNKTRGVGVLPLFFVGKTNYVNNWLFIKNGCSPRLVRSADVYGNNPIVLKKTSKNENTVLIDALSEPKKKQDLLKKQFGIEDINENIEVFLDETDTKLLKSYR